MGRLLQLKLSIFHCISNSLSAEAHAALLAAQLITSFPRIAGVLLSGDSSIVIAVP